VNHKKQKIFQITPFAADKKFHRGGKRQTI